MRLQTGTHGGYLLQSLCISWMSLKFQGEIKFYVETTVSETTVCLKLQISKSGLAEVSVLKYTLDGHLINGWGHHIMEVFIKLLGLDPTLQNIGAFRSSRWINCPSQASNSCPSFLCKGPAIGVCLYMCMRRCISVQCIHFSVYDVI